MAKRLPPIRRPELWARLKREHRDKAFEKRWKECTKAFEKQGVEAGEAHKRGFYKVAEEFLPLDAIDVETGEALVDQAEVDETAAPATEFTIHPVAYAPEEESASVAAFVRAFTEDEEPAAESAAPPAKLGDRVNVVKAVRWVFEALDSSPELAQDAPSPGARALLRWAQENAGARAKFYERAFRILGSDEEVSEARRYGDPAKSTHELLDRLAKATKGGADG